MGSGVATPFYQPRIAEGTEIRLKYFIPTDVDFDNESFNQANDKGLVCEVYEKVAGSWVQRGSIEQWHQVLTRPDSYSRYFRVSLGLTAGTALTAAYSGIEDLYVRVTSHPEVGGSASSDPEISNVAMVDVTSLKGNVYTRLIEGTVDGT